MKTVHKPSVVPVYAVGITWILYTVLFGLSSIWKVLLCAVISAAVYFIVKAACPGKTEQVEIPEEAPDTGNAALDEAILQGRESVKRIRKLNAQIPDAKITAQLNDIETTTAKILQQLEKNTDQLSRCRQFLNYYLPTTIKLLEQYVKLQSQGLRAGNIDEAMKKIEELLATVQTAFRKQLDSLFASDVVDITADIAVMEQMMKAQGLTDQPDFQ
jgi:5-bromo-4-chloroindolyl phosphate hydrolysis protein